MVTQPERKRVIVAITGATGAIYGIRALERLAAEPSIETHVIISKHGRETVSAETTYSPAEVEALADVVHRPGDVGATIASGSFHTSGMVIAPCSIKTLSAIANCYDADLVTRAADVTLKEGRPLTLLLRETPLHLGHIKLMKKAAEAGAVIAPPVPAFYNQPTTLDDIIGYTVDRMLSRLGLLSSGPTEWQGMGSARNVASANGQAGHRAAF